jgi:AcrR family transcriptional regulator
MMASQEKSPANRSGRESQKNRTRRALIQAAGELMAAGRQPTVSDAAEASGISRATAYRYFPSQEMLLAEVALFAVGGPLFTPAHDTAPLADQVAHLVRRVGAWTYDNEHALRALLRLSLDPASGVRRPGHRVEWIANALAPHRSEIPTTTYRRLSQALTLLLGIDPIVVMTDIAGAGRKEALDALEWTARSLIHSALSERAEPRKSTTRSTRTRT